MILNITSIGITSASLLDVCEEEVGFEPTGLLHPNAFKALTLNHSVTPPRSSSSYV